MNKQFLAATLAAALMVPMASHAVDATLYGRVVVGVDRQDSDNQGESATWNLGASGRGIGTRGTTGERTGAQQSRIGFRADHELDNGMSVGLRLEQGFDDDSGPNNQRHRFVSLSGGFGTVTVGNQANPYLMGANWAQEYFLGGNTVGSFREEGIGYSMSSGPFSLNVLLTGDNGDSSVNPVAPTPTNRMLIPAETDADYLARVTALAQADVDVTIPERNMNEMDGAYAGRINALLPQDDRVMQRAVETAAQQRQRLSDATGVRRNVGETDTAFDMRIAAAPILADVAAQEAYRADQARKRVADETVDRVIVGASYDFGIVKVGFGYNKDNTENDYDWFSVGASGTVGQFGYHVGWQQKDDARQKVAGTNIGEEDQAGWGTFLYYDIGDSDRVYLEYETLEDDFGTKDDRDFTILGYSHSFGGGVNFVGEYRTTSNSAANAAEPNRLALAMIVNF